MLELLVKAMRPDYKRKFKSVYNKLPDNILTGDLREPDLVYNEKYMRNIDLSLADIHMYVCNMGGGKTTALIDLVKNQLNDYVEKSGIDLNGIKIVLITSRVALAD